jgi:hypothetical protein
MAANHNTDVKFDEVRSAGLSLPGVTASIKYDGSPILKVRGCFMAGLARHPSAEPDSLVVRMELEQREWLLADAPDVYYVTDYYERYPIVLARLPRLEGAALRDLLNVSYCLTLAKARRRTGP